MNKRQIRQLTQLARARSQEYRQSHLALDAARELEEQRQARRRIANLAGVRPGKESKSEALARASAARSDLNDR